MPTSQHFTTSAAAQRLIPVLRSPDAPAAVARVTELLRAGCRVVELTTSTADWAQALADCRALREKYAGALLGLGTVTTAEQARAALDLDADFLVSPFPAPEARRVAQDAGAVFVEGGFSPAEIADAASRGPAKVFPAHVGGPTYLRSLRAILPAAQLIPTGGIAIDRVQDYLDAGAVAVGIGSGLPSDPDALAAVFAPQG